MTKFIPDTTASHPTCLSFVAEGEASLHFAVKNGLQIGVVEAGEGNVIVDRPTASGKPTGSRQEIWESFASSR
jgi:hypothetical protein